MKLAERAAALAAGAVFPFSFAPFSWWPLAIVSLAILFHSIDGVTARRAAVIGSLFGLGQFGAGVWWVFVSVHEFGGLHWSLAILLTTALIGVLAVFPALFAWLGVRIAPRHPVWRRCAAWPALWVAVEWLRGWILTGFPWLSTGYAFIDTPLGALAPVGGVHVVSLAAAVSAGAVVVIGRDAYRRSYGAMVPPLAVIAVIWAGAWIIDGVRWTQPAGAPVSVALVQGNIGQDLKWAPEYLEPTIERYMGLHAGQADADIVVWPEAALPALRNHLYDLLEVLDARTADDDAVLVMGVLDQDPGTGQYFNTVIALGAGEGRYAKRHLVPFGEFFPVPAFIREWLRLMNLPYSDFSRGARDQAPLDANGIAIGVSICWEAGYGVELIRALPEARLLVNVSNDAWFGDTIAPHQHLQIARMRAREAGRWMLRATNTGVTAAIAPDGRVAMELPQFVADVLRIEVEPYMGATPYARVRNWPVLALIALILGVSGRFRYPNGPS